MRNVTISALMPRSVVQLLRLAARCACIAALALPLAIPAPAAAAVKHRKAPVKHKPAATKYKPAAAKHPKAKKTKPAAKKAIARKLHSASAPKAAKLAAVRKTGATDNLRPVGVEKPRPAIATWPRAVDAFKPQAAGTDGLQPAGAAKPLRLEAAGPPEAESDLPPPVSAKILCRRGDRIYLLADCGASELPAALAAGPADGEPRQLQ